MKKYQLLLILAMIATSFFLSDILVSQSSSVEGIWKASIKNRNGKSFEAQIGIKKIESDRGEVYQVKGTSKDKTIAWYGEGSFSGGTFKYNYKIYGKNIFGMASLKMGNGNTMEGSFDEGQKYKNTKGEEIFKKRYSGQETWEKIASVPTTPPIVSESKE